jgi:predicted extracellular nuclease
VVEFRPGGSGGFENLTITEITTPNTFSVVSIENELPVTIVGEDGLMPPNEVIDDDTAGGDGTIDGAGAVTTYDPATDGIDFYESLEGMYVQVNDARAVGPRNNFGEIAIVGDGGEHAGPFTARGGLIIGPGAFNPERLHLDDVLQPTPTVNVGDEFTTAVTGVMDYSFGNFKLLPTTALVGVDNGLVREAADATGSRELAVATYNVENLTVGNPQAKFDELAGQIIHNLQSPDLIAIEEMQDDSGASNNGVVTAQQGWDRLIAAIVIGGGPDYQFRSIDPVNNADGGAPGSNIRVGFLFRTDRGLEFVDRPGGTAITDTGVDPTANGKAAQLTISPGRVLPDPAGPFANSFFATRKSLAGEFRWRGETLFVVANHLSSKGDDHPLFGRFQPPVRFTEFASGTPEDGWRHAQAQVINDFVDEILAVDDDAHVIVLGDINDFHFSETVGVLTGELVAGAGGPEPDGSGPTLPSGEVPVLATLFDELAADEQYSYVFEGNSQVLDQVLVSTSLLVLDPRYDVVHVNAEFASQASDHDPSVMRVAFQPRRGR